MNAPAVTFANRTQPFEEKECILLMIEDQFSAIAASHDVINRTRIDES